MVIVAVIYVSQVVMKKALEIPGAGLHWYGKAESREGRKMGMTTDNLQCPLFLLPPMLSPIYLYLIAAAT